ncbi:unnamed protein product [Lathyrus oleraceus]
MEAPHRCRVSKKFKGSPLQLVVIFNTCVRVERSLLMKLMRGLAQLLELPMLKIYNYGDEHMVKVRWETDDLESSEGGSTLGLGKVGHGLIKAWNFGKKTKDREEKKTRVAWD